MFNVTKELYAVQLKLEMRDVKQMHTRMVCRGILTGSIAFLLMGILVGEKVRLYMYDNSLSFVELTDQMITNSTEIDTQTEITSSSFENEVRFI